MKLFTTSDLVFIASSFLSHFNNKLINIILTLQKNICQILVFLKTGSYKSTPIFNA